MWNILCSPSNADEVPSSCVVAALSISLAAATLFEGPARLFGLTLITSAGSSWIFTKELADVRRIMEDGANDLEWAIQSVVAEVPRRLDSNLYLQKETKRTKGEKGEP